MKKILLIMPYFERPNMVINALNSFRQIKYDNYEIAIIDDGSVKYPIHNVLEDFEKIKNVKIYYTNDNIDNKIKRGSIHGKYMNIAIKDSDADIVVMMSDDDAVHPDYFINLNNFYNLNDVKYAYSHIIPFDPYIEIIDENTIFNLSKKSWNTRAEINLNKTISLNPYCNVDSTQISWKIECNKNDGVWFPEEQTKNLDASFYNQMYTKYGLCMFTGFYSMYKAFHSDQLGNRNGIEQFQPSDLPKKPNINIGE